MGAFSLPIQPRTNPYIEEIDEAVKRGVMPSSAGAQEAIRRAGVTVHGQPAAAAPTPQITSPAQPVKGIMPEEGREPGPADLAAGQPAISAPTTSAHVATPPAIQPVQPTAAAGPAQAEMTRLAGSKAGVDQIKSPWARIPLQVLAGLGETFAPRLAQALPGTESHHRMLLGEAENAVGQQEAIRKAEENAQAEAAKASLEQAQAHGAEATAQATEEEGKFPSGRQYVKVGKDGLYDAQTKQWVREPSDAQEGGTVHETKDGKLVVVHPNGQATLVTMGGQPVEGAPKAGAEGEMPLGERVAQLNQALTSRYQVLHPKAPLPQQYQIPANATQKDYDRIDKALEAEERATGTLAQQEQANEMRRQTAAIAQGNQATAALDRETQQYRTSHAKAVTDADAQLERIQEARAMLSSGSAEAQALAVPKVMTALVSGQGSGVRITQPELNAIISARGLGGSFEAFMQRIQSGKKLTPEQAQQLQAVLSDAESKVVQKQQVHNEALDKIGTAGSRNDIIKADQEARQKLGNLEKGGGTTKIQQNSKGEFRYSTDGGKTWQSGKPPQ